MSTTRKFQVTVRVESDEELDDYQWDEAVADNLTDAIESADIDSIYIDRDCGECGSEEEVCVYLSISDVNVTLPDPVRAGVIGLPK